MRSEWVKHRQAKPEYLHQPSISYSLVVLFVRVKSSPAWTELNVSVSPLPLSFLVSRLRNLGVIDVVNFAFVEAFSYTGHISAIHKVIIVTKPYKSNSNLTHEWNRNYTAVANARKMPVQTADCDNIPAAAEARLHMCSFRLSSVRFLSGPKHELILWSR